ncbi:cytochrome P450 [Nocardia abscessus]|uniref:cytochrome P450 n=1 Tax=Nocardia abscessus TaxID=120957 RepID=UPI0012F88EFC|nr:cytochrome P450 [Nocardia abscessus]MCC3328274.1 cytochrome P450 [Nocardia abscessus]
MRADRGPLVSVEIAAGVTAVLVLDHDIARRILPDDDHFPADPRGWQRTVGSDCPALPVLGWRPDALRSDGAEHIRYRGAVTDSLKCIDQFALRRATEFTAKELINGFCAAGAADLLHDFAIPLTVTVLDRLLGLPPEPARQAFTATAAPSDVIDPAAAHQSLIEAMEEVVEIKRRRLGPDMTSSLLEHRSGLSTVEVAHALAMLYALGSELTWNLIGITLLETMTAGLAGGALSIRELIDEALFADPPLANACPRFPRQMQIVDGVMLQPHRPVLVSLAACNGSVSGDRGGNRSHLAWGAGKHACPARDEALIIAEEALGQLLDALPDIQLAIPADGLRWQPNPFLRALKALPVTFPPSPPLPLT